MLRPENDTEVFISSPIESPQYLVRVYHDTQGTTRTVATREHPGATWSPEHLLLTEHAQLPAWCTCPDDCDCDGQLVSP